MLFSTNPRATAFTLVSLSLSALPALAQEWTEDRWQVTDPDGPYYRRPIAGYVPVIWPAAIFACLFGFLTVLSWWHYWAVRRYVLILPISLTAMTIGFILRIIAHKSPFSTGIYAIQMLLILLSPCGFLATCYVLLGRLAVHLDAQDCLLIRASLISKIFVISDITTFLVQAVGSSSQMINESFAKAGHYIAFAGLVVQVCSFGLFCILLLIWAKRLRASHPATYSRRDSNVSLRPAYLFSRRGHDHWKVVLYCTLFACVGLFIRCVFRCVEFYGGFDGYLATTEIYAYLLDSLPLVICMAPYVIFWPGTFLPVSAGVTHKSVDGGIEIGSPVVNKIEMQPTPAYR